MTCAIYEFEAPIWKRSSKHPHMIDKGSRYFVNVPKSITQSIQQAISHIPRRGWGSIPVTVRVGYVTWHTSIFPDTQSQTYLLPLKAKIRKELHLQDDTILACEIAIAL